ncbi:serine/threonine protein phosphatase [Motiliproteus coralliicola]|uniref:Serine/threonine protein phosphatase n=1 Tax=Motiliproteus coralliicola TaxID=2283196 RepID=A0A369WU80_9GAMM|nr:metallophosphoesterase [Motiliproteus coralliicola]RDE25161.1 serine/threonine protein phosphatase [Motiliproteus coralliicola]
MSATPHFISDLHLGHKKILQFSNQWRGGTTIQEHDDWIVTQWNKTIGKRDPVYVLGDVAFTREGLQRVKELNGQKFLIMGNHDFAQIHEYEDVGFRILGGIVKYKGFWLSHAPIHPNELRGCANIHGHVHSESIDDSRYINVCVEPLGGVPLSIHEISRRNLV